MKKILPFLLFGFCAAFLSAQELDFTPVSLSGGTLSEITDITGSGDGTGRLFIAQRNGNVRIVLNGVIASQNFLSIGGLVEDDNGERGLLGLTFHPDYPDSPYIYVNYVIDNTNISRISRFTVPDSSPGNADEATERIIMEIPGIQPNHKAGDLNFGPDGYLYITTGDGGGGGDPQDTGQDFTRRLGKILRVNIDETNPPINYTIPPTNPYLPYTGTGDTLPEIFMNGVRNPWRMSFDSETGDIWIADVGQNLYEEVNMIPEGTGAGKNLGWDCLEGLHDFSTSTHCDTIDMPLTPPIFEYPHNCPCPFGNGFSVTGGFVYRGNDYPDLYGVYMAVDFSTNDVFLIEQTGPSSFTFFGHNANGNSGVTTFGEADNGEIFAGNLGGTLYTVSRGELLPLRWEDLSATPLTSGNKIKWTLHHTSDVEYFELQRSQLMDFSSLTSVAEIMPNATAISYNYHDPYVATHSIYYRVAAHMLDGSIEHSPIARIIPDPVSKPTLTYDFTTDLWRIHLPAFWRNGELTLHDLQGKLVFSSILAEQAHFDLVRPFIPGVYYITIRGDEGTWSDKIVR